MWHAYSGHVASPGSARIKYPKVWHTSSLDLSNAPEPTSGDMAPNDTSISFTDPWQLHPLTTQPTASSSNPRADICPDLTEEVQILSWVHTHSGAYSSIYKGLWGAREVAVKVIRPLVTDTLRATRRRMRREIRTVSHLNHPNILPIYGVLEPEWCDYGCIVTPWCRNGDASNYIRREHVESLERYRLLCDVATGLEHLHGLSIVHGDIKPGNILIDDAGRSLICDFGLVHNLRIGRSEVVDDNTTTVHIGTVRYLAYELVKPDPPDARSMASDIHALGCVAYEFMYLEHPYANRVSNAAGHIFRDIAEGIPPAYRPRNLPQPSIGALWDFLEECWDREPTRRPVMAAVRAKLGNLAEHEV